MFQIRFTSEAVEDLRGLNKYAQRRIVEAIERQLMDQPNRQTRNRKQLRPNQLAEWELRVGGFRVFYDVDSTNATVKIEAVGQKRGSALLIRGEEYTL